ncbi:MAG TPA: hypothetical protein VNF73_00815, partial [Candidatus Saccharimonadales bacterium]|nr:hypothetical protein [Candidatus Saccharimonadales bacterium]
MQRRPQGQPSSRHVAAPGLAALIAMSALLGGALAPSLAQAADAPNVLVPLGRGATTQITAQPTGSGAEASLATEIPNTDALERSPKVGIRGAAPLNSAATTPNPAPQSVTRFNPGFSGFNGLSHYDSRTASGGNQFSLEPPDQGLCVGNGFVMETINDVLAVYDTRGRMVAGPEALNAFLGYPPAVDRTNGGFGPFVTDPRCLYDAQTNRWIHTDLTLEVDPSTGAFTGVTHVDIAVSQSGNPTGKWSIFSLDTTDDGAHGGPSHPGCPCLGDQPLLGADTNGIYITTNEFPVFANGFNGAQVYAISKRGLTFAANGGPLPSVAMIDAGALATPDMGGTWYSLQPAVSPAGNQGDGRGGFGPSYGNGPFGGQGTEYFLSALDFFGTADNRIAAWALTNTSSLDRRFPNVSLSNIVIASEPYASSLTWGVTQKAGPTPLGTSLGEGLEQLNANDDRMNQVVFSNGRLYSGVNTLVGDGSRTGIAYFEVNPGWQHGTLTATMAAQGYVSLRNDSVFFPSIGVNQSGAAVMSFTISGPDYYPSAGYARILGPSAGPVHVAGVGQAPEDGFTGYAAYGGAGIARWGDYSAAVADQNGNVWVAAEYIPGGTRTELANWGTFVGHVNAFGGF